MATPLPSVNRGIRWPTLVRNDVKDQVRAKLRTRVKRLLLKHGYPPDQEPPATELIIKRAEVIAEHE